MRNRKKKNNIIYYYNLKKYRHLYFSSLHLLCNKTFNVVTFQYYLRRGIKCEKKKNLLYVKNYNKPILEINRNDRKLIEMTISQRHSYYGLVRTSIFLSIFIIVLIIESYTIYISASFVVNTVPLFVPQFFRREIKLQRKLSVVTAPLISLRRFFDVLTLTDEFTANIVLFHLMSASHAFLRTFRADGRLDNGFNPIIGICVCARVYVCVVCSYYKQCLPSKFRH